MAEIDLPLSDGRDGAAALLVLLSGMVFQATRSAAAEPRQLAYRWPRPKRLISRIAFPAVSVGCN